MAKAEITNGLLEGLPGRDELEARLVANARERTLLQQLLKVVKQQEAVGRSAADVQRNRRGLGQ